MAVGDVATSSAVVDRIRAWRDDPVLFVQDVFKATPDAWQVDVLRAFPMNQRLAMKACKGPGKSTVLSWLVWNFIATRPRAKVVATSITADTLADTLWAEFAKWYERSPFLKRQFTWGKTQITNNESPGDSFVTARSWPKTADAAQQSAALAGYHADYILFVLDESGGIPDAVMASAEAALSSAVEGRIVQAGNPTHLEGPLYRACTTERHLWHVTEITSDPDDPKRTPRVSAQWAREQIEKYGRDNPYVLVNVFGQFPPSSMNALIGPDEVRAAIARSYRPQDYANAARVLGVDVAREGLDSSVIFPRQGLQAFTPLVYRNLDGTEGAKIVGRKWRDWDADACFIDNTGGFGSSWIDNTRRLGMQPIGVHFSERSSDERFYNKRSEMIFGLIQWIKDGGALPDVPELSAALTKTTYTFKGSKLIIEPKEDVKTKLGYSPDHMDALALTFSHPVTRSTAYALMSYSTHSVHYDPLSLDYARQDMGLGDRKGDGGGGMYRPPIHQIHYDPLRVGANPALLGSAN